jgi:acetyl esterase/lipase
MLKLSFSNAFVHLIVPAFFLGASSTQDQYLRRPDVESLPSKPADHRISYGPDSLQFADLRIPSGQWPHPVAVVVHGGCWLEVGATLKHSAALADGLRDLGVATWNVEYRRVGYPGGGWPGTFNDVARAVDHLRGIEAQYQLDLDRVVLVGHSAGGQLVLWLAARHRLQSDSPIYTRDPLRALGVVVLGGPGDLALIADRTFCGEEKVVHKLLGGSPKEVPGRYAQTSPIELLPIGVQQIVISGADDWSVPPEDSRRYVEAARLAGDSAEHVIVEQAGHHEYNVPGATTWSAVKGAVFSILGLVSE